VPVNIISPSSLYKNRGGILSLSLISF